MTYPGNVERPPQIQVDPGLRASAGSPTRAHVVLTNAATAPRILQISTHGLDATWLPPVSRSRVLQPGESIAVELTFRPALGTVPAVYPLAIAVQALDPVTESATAQVALADVQLTVDAPGQLSLRLSPAEISGLKRRKVEVEVENTGSAPASVHLESEGSSGTQIELEQTVVEVPPGQIRQVRAKVGVKRRRMFGERIRHSYTVTGRARGAPHVAEGAFTARPLLGRSTGMIAVIVSILAIWTGSVIVFIPKLADHVKNSHAAQVATTQSASPSPSGGSGGGGGKKGGGSGGSGSGGGGSNSGSGGGSQTPKPGGATNAAATNSVQFNGTVSGSAPGGVVVTVSPVSPVEAINSAQTGTTPAGDSVKPLDFSADQVTGKISSDMMTAALPYTVSQHKTTVTSKDGAWAIPGVAKPGYYLVTFSKPGFQTARFIVDSSSPAASQPMPVTLVSGQGSLTGTVSGPRGAVGGATISITDGTNTLSTSTTSRGTVGHWSVTGLSTPDTYLVTVSANGLATESTLVSLGAGASSNIALSLPSGVTSLQGKVVGQDNNGNVAGLGGATVTVSNATLSRSATTVTKGGVVGNYILPALPPGDYTVSVSADGYVTQTSKITLQNGESAKTLNATLTSSSGSVYGTVTDSAKVGQVGAGVVLANATNTYKTTTTSSPEGGFTFDGVAPGIYTLTVTMFGFETATETVTATQGGLKQLTVGLAAATSTVAATGSIKGGQVIDAQKLTSLPSSVQLTATLLDPPTDEPGCSFTWGPKSASQQFQLPDPSTSTKGANCGLAPGLYSVKISTAEYEDATFSVAVALGTATTAPTVSLNTKPVIAGTVTSAIGTPAAPTCVWAVAQFGDGVNVAQSALTCNTPVTGCPAATAQPSGAVCATPLVGGAPSALGSYSIVLPLHGSYSVYIVSGDAEYNTASGGLAAPPLNFALGVADSKPYDVQLHRFGRLTLSVLYPGGSGGTLQAVPVGTGVKGYTNSSCTGTPVWTGSTTAGGQLLVSNLAPTTYYFSSSYLTYSSDCQQQAIGLDQDLSNTLPLIKAIGVTVGQLTYSYLGGAQPLANARLSVSGPTSYNGNTPNIGSWTVTTDANGCFAVVSAGATIPSTPITGACAALDLSATSGSGTTPVAETGNKLLSNVVTVTTNIAGTGYTNISAVPVTMSAYPAVTTVATLATSSVPFASSQTQNSITVQGTSPVNWAVGSSDFNLVVTPQDPAHQDAVTATLANGGGAAVPGWGQISLTQDGVANALTPGKYDVSVSHSGYVADTASLSDTTVSGVLTCLPPALPATTSSCTLAPASLQLIELGHLTISGLPSVSNPAGGEDIRDNSSGNPVATLVQLYDNGGLEQTQNDTSGTGSVTFDNVLPNHSGYVVKIRAAGYQYTDDAAKDDLLHSSCESGTAPNQVLATLSAGQSLNCQAFLRELGEITGTVNVQDMQITSTSTTPPTYAPGGAPGWRSTLGGASVTATLCSNAPTLIGPGVYSCTPASAAAHPGYFVTKTVTADPTTGHFIIAADTTNDNEQGLAGGDWIVAAQPADSSKQPYYCMQKPTNAAPTACPSSTAGTVTGALAQITVATDGNGIPPVTVNTLLYHTAASLTVTAVDNYGYPASHVTILVADSSGGSTVNGVTVQGTEESGSPGTYDFPALQPGTYYVKFSGGAFGWEAGTGWAVSGTQLIIADGGTTGSVVVTHAGYTLGGTITANGTPVQGATVCLKVDTSSATQPCSNTSDTVKSYPTAGPSNPSDAHYLSAVTPSAGTYSFDNIPATPAGEHYYLRVEAYGYTSVVIDGTPTYSDGLTFTGGSDVAKTLGYDFTLSDAVKRNIKITITATNSSDDLSGLAAETNGALGVGIASTGTGWPGASASEFTNESFSAGSSNQQAVLNINQVPFGCWTFSYDLAGHVTGHFGTATYTGSPSGQTPASPNDASLGCPAGTIRVSGDSTDASSVAVDVSLSEYPAQLTIHACSTSCYGLTNQPSAVTVATTDHTTHAALYSNGSFPVGDTAQNIGWYGSSQVADVTVTAPGASPAWAMPSISQITSSAASPEGTLAVNHKSVTVDVSADYSGTLDGATVALTPPSDDTGFSGTSVITGSGSNGHGEATFDLPYGSGWSAAISSNDAYVNDGSIASFDVSSSAPSVSTATVNLTRSTKSVTVTAAPEYGPTSLLDGGSVTLNAPSGWSGVSVSCTALSSGSSTCSNVPYGSGWTFTVSGLSDFNSATSSVFIVDGSNPGTNPAVTVNQKTKNVTVHVSGQYVSGSDLSGASVDVTATPASGTGNPFPTTISCTATNASGDSTCSGVPYGSGWVFTASDDPGFVAKSSSAITLDSSSTNPIASLSLNRVTHTVTLTVTQGDGTTALSLATVTLTAPSDLSGFTPSLSYHGGGSSTDSTGQVTVTLPYDTGWKASVNYGAKALNLVSGSPFDSISDSSVTLETQTQTVQVTVTDSGAAVQSASVSLHTGSSSTVLSAFGNTNASGQTSALLTWGTDTFDASKGSKNGTSTNVIDNTGSNPIAVAVAIS